MQWFMQVLTDVGRAGRGLYRGHADDAAELGLHGVERCDDELGAVGHRHPGRGDERREPEDPLRQPGSLAVPDARGHQLRPGATWVQAHHLASPAGRRPDVRPVPRTGRLYGPIESDWKIEGGAFLWNVAVPPNTTATVYVPAKDAKTVTEGNRPAGEASGVRFLQMEGGAAVFSVGSGSYLFRGTS